MPLTCEKCNKEFPFRIMIDGKTRNLCKRKFCLECSPFGQHNTINISKIKENSEEEPICTKCGKTGKENFYERKNRKKKYQSACKECMNSSKTDNSKNKKKLAVEYKGGSCQCCGYDKCDRSLEFHHLDPNEKDSSIRFTTVSNKRLFTELDKCILVCTNCHREIHAGLRDISEFIVEGDFYANLPEV